MIYRVAIAGIENSIPTLLSDGVQPSWPLKHQQLRLKRIYGASWPLYFDVSLYLLITSILVQFFMILSASLDSWEKSKLERAGGWTMRPPVTVAVGYKSRNVMPLMTPRWSYLSGGDPIAAIGAPYPMPSPYPLPISTKIYPREPKIADYSKHL